MKWLIRLFLKMYRTKLQNEIYDIKTCYTRGFSLLGSTWEHLVAFQKQEKERISEIQVKIDRVNEVLKNI